MTDALRRRELTRCAIARLNAPQRLLFNPEKPLSEVLKRTASEG